MIRIGFIGRTKILFDTIKLFQKLDKFEISFIWTCQDEEYYQFGHANFEKIANDINCEFIYSSIINEYADSVAADIVISINFINVIPKSFIDKFKFGILNAHAGDLPRYRGNACPNWAILNSEKRIFLTIHQMDEGLDSGPIVVKKKFELENDTYIGEVYEWLYRSAPNLFVSAINNVLNDTPLEKQKGRALRTFPRKPEDAKLNFTLGLDWNYRLIRASSKPFDGAFAYLNGDTMCKVVIYKALPHSIGYDFLAVSGQIMERIALDHSFVLAVGDEALKVVDYSLNGKPKENSFKTVCSSLRNRLT